MLWWLHNIKCGPPSPLGVRAPSIKQRETQHTSPQARTHMPSHQAHAPCRISVDKTQPTQCLHHRDTGVSQEEVGGTALAMGDTTPSTNTQQQVPEMKRKSEEKGWKTIRGVKELLRRKHTTGERDMILVSNRGPSLGVLSGASDTPGTQEASRVFLSKDINREGGGPVIPESASYPYRFGFGL